MSHGVICPPNHHPTGVLNRLIPLLLAQELPHHVVFTHYLMFLLFSLIVSPYPCHSSIISFLLDELSTDTVVRGSAKEHVVGGACRFRDAQRGLLLMTDTLVRGYFLPAVRPRVVHCVA